MHIQEIPLANAAEIACGNQSIDQPFPIEIPEPWPNKNFTMILTGSMGSGKSTLLQSITTSRLIKSRVYAKVFDTVYYLTPRSAFTSEARHPFRDHPRVYHQLTPDILHEIMEQMDKAKEDVDEYNMNKDKKRNFTKKKHPNSLVIIDDFSEELRDKRLEKPLMDLLFKHRHRNSSVILTSLTMKNLMPCYRKLVRIFVVFKPKSKLEVQGFCDEIMTISRENVRVLFQHVFQKKHDFLFIDTHQAPTTFYRNFNRLIFNEE